MIMIPNKFFEDYTERNKGRLNKWLLKDHDAHVVEQGCLVQAIQGTGSQLVTVVYLVRPNSADMGAVKLAGNVFNAWIRAILTLLKHLGEINGKP